MAEESSPERERPDWSAAVADASAEADERVEAQDSAEAPKSQNVQAIVLGVSLVLLFASLWRLLGAWTAPPPDLPPEEARRDLITMVAWTVDDIESIAADSGRVLQPEEIASLELLPAEEWRYVLDGFHYVVEARQDEHLVRYHSSQTAQVWLDSLRGGGG